MIQVKISNTGLTSVVGHHQTQGLALATLGECLHSLSLVELKLDLHKA